MNINHKRKIVVDYIQKNPGCTCKNIKKDTKIKIERIYNSLKDAYREANVNLSKSLTKRNLSNQKADVIKFIKKNPECSVSEIQNNTKVNVSRTFGSIINAYESAEVTYVQKEITHGVRNPVVAKRCRDFEKEITNLLRRIGEVKPKVRTPSGIVDCTLKCEDKEYIVEIKDFRGKNNITMHELKQLIRYMKELNCKNGLLICPKESFPKRKNSRNIYIDGLSLRILSKEDLYGAVV